MVASPQTGCSLWRYLVWLYSGTVSVFCTVCGLMAVVCGYEGWKQDFVNVGQKNFVKFSLFLGIILIIFVIVWNLSAMFFLKVALQLSGHLRVKREAHQSSKTSLGSLNQSRNFSQVSGLLMLGMLLACISLEVAGTGYLWYVFLQISDVYERQLRNNIGFFCDANNEESVCKEAYNQFKNWFLIFRVLLPVLAILKFPAFIINCFAWVIVDLDNGHPLNPVRNSGYPSVSLSFNHSNDPVDYYGHMSLPIGERPQTIGQELTPKLATARTRALSNKPCSAATRAMSNKPVCVPCPKAPLDRFQSRGQCSTPVRLENIICSPMLGLQVPTPEMASFYAVHHQPSPYFNNTLENSKIYGSRLEVPGKSWCVNSSKSVMADDQFYDGSRQNLSTPSTQIAKTNKGSFSSETNQHCSIKAGSDPAQYMEIGHLVKPKALNNSRILRSKLPTPPPPPPPPRLCDNNQRRWTTNQVAFCSNSPKLPKKDLTENYASLSRSFGKRLSSQCIIENI